MEKKVEGSGEGGSGHGTLEWLVSVEEARVLTVLEERPTAA